MEGKFSLSFSKTVEKKSLQPSVLKNDIPVLSKSKAENIESIEKNIIKTDGPVEQEMIIPLIQLDRSTIFKKLKEKQKKLQEKNKLPTIESENLGRPLTLDERAELALLQESRDLVEKESKMNINLAIAQPSTDNDDMLFSGPTLGKVSSLDDYDSVSVECYGAALLRGMGWKKNEGVGKTNKEVVGMIDPSNKTLSLAGGKSKKKTQLQSEELELRKNSCVSIHSGRRKGKYGIVQSVDEDGVLVEIALTHDIVREVEQNLTVINKNDYKTSSRNINKAGYDKFKAIEAASKKKKHSHSESDDDTIKNPEHVIGKGLDDKLKMLKEKKRTGMNKKDSKESYSRKREHKSIDDDNYKQERKQESQIKSEDSSVRLQSRLNDSYKHNKHKSIDERKPTKDKGSVKRDSLYSSYSTTSCDHMVNKPLIPPWVREGLKVRMIDKHYKSGKYYKQKVIVHSVITAESCEVMTEDSRMLYDVKPSLLETVIPKKPAMNVMVVRGDYMQHKGRIIELHRNEDKASIQIFGDNNIVKFDYNDICEYVNI